MTNTVPTTGVSTNQNYLEYAGQMQLQSGWARQQQSPYAAWELVTTTKPAPQIPPIQVEGVYLKGQGMVFTVTMPPWPQSEVIDLQARVEAPSDWEQAKRQVRGENTLLELSFQLHTGPGLKEVLLKLLAENGKHLRHLPDNENVTVVVIFRGQPAPQPKVTSVQVGSMKDAQVNITPKPSGTSSAVPPKTPPPQQAQQPRGISDRQMLYESYRRLYELQVKQGRMDEARKAIDQMLNLLTEDWGDTDAEYQLRLELLKQAQRFYLSLDNLSAEDVNRMRKAANDMNELLTKMQGQKPSKPATAVPTPRIPSRLTLAVSKKALVEAGQAKADPTAFAKQVQIEELSWKK
jgi:hypothetical protein